MKIFAETERLILREIVPSDQQGIFELDSDPEVHKFLGNKTIKTIEEAKQIIEFIRIQYVENGIGRWAVIEKETEAFIGWAGLKLITDTINNHTHYYDLGYRLIRKYWGKGFASESAKASLQYGFENLKLNSIYGMANVNNISSTKVLEKLGFFHIETFEYFGEGHNWFRIEIEKSKEG